MGVSQLRRFYCKRSHTERCDCKLSHCHNTGGQEWTDGFSSSPGPYEDCCEGRRGQSGRSGRNGGNGRSGSQGEKGPDGEDGVNGADG